MAAFGQHLQYLINKHCTPLYTTSQHCICPSAKFIACCAAFTDQHSLLVCKPSTPPVHLLHLAKRVFQILQGRKWARVQTWPRCSFQCFQKMDDSQDFCLLRGETQQGELSYILPLERFAPFPLPYLCLFWLLLAGHFPYLRPFILAPPHPFAGWGGFALWDVMTEGPGHVLHEETFRVPKTHSNIHARQSTDHMVNGLIQL